MAPRLSPIVLAAALLAPVEQSAALAFTVTPQERQTIGLGAPEQVSEILRAQRDFGHSVDQGLIEELEPHAARDPELLVSILLDGAAPGIGETEPQLLNRYQEQMLLEALSSVDSSRIAPLIPRRVELATAGPNRLRRSLALFATTQPGSKAGQLLDLARRAPDEEGLPVPLGLDRIDALRDALAVSIARDPAAAIESLERPLRSGTDEEATAILNALGDSGSPHALPVCLDEIRSGRRALVVVAPQVVRVGRSIDPALNEEVASSLLPGLDSQDVNTALQALRGLEALEARTGVERVVEFLDHDSRSLREQAHRTLRAVTRCNYPLDVGLWRELVADQIAIEENVDELVHEVERSTPATMASALRRIQDVSLARHSVSRALAPLVESERHGLSDRVATILAQLDSPWSIEPLAVGLYRNPDSELVHRALTGVTGLDLGPQPFEWQVALAELQPSY